MRTGLQLGRCHYQRSGAPFAPFEGSLDSWREAYRPATPKSGPSGYGPMTDLQTSCWQGPLLARLGRTDWSPFGNGERIKSCRSGEGRSPTNPFPDPLTLSRARAASAAAGHLGRARQGRAGHTTVMGQSRRAQNAAASPSSQVATAAHTKSSMVTPRACARRFMVLMPPTRFPVSICDR